MKYLYFLFFVTFAFPASAATQCTHKQALAAEGAVDSLSSWAKVNSFYKKYKQCDEGSIAEGSSDAVAHLLADRWDKLPELNRFIKADDDFKQYIFSHINGSLNDDQVKKIVSLSNSSCPEGMNAFCNELTDVATKTLKEMQNSPQ